MSAVTPTPSPAATKSMAKPPPTGPTPPPPVSVRPPATNGTPSTVKPAPAVNGTRGAKPVKKTVEPPDPVTMYESVRSRIAALEEEEVHGEEEERKLAEEARKAVKGVPDSAIHTKYIELFQEMKRLEREHAKEKQKLTKDKDAAKSQLTKSNQSRLKLESLARELQKENKKLREDSKRLAISMEEAQEEMVTIKNEIERRADQAKQKERQYQASPDIVVKVVCRYRAELYFRVSRKAKLSRLFNAWTERMDVSNSPNATKGENKSRGVDTATTTFLFTHLGRSVEPDQTPEEIGIEDRDEILAVEIMDLTTDAEEIPEIHRERIKKSWTSEPQEAKRAITDIFDGVVRDRLKDVLRQYEVREKHFDCVIRSKELEVLLSKARAEEQKQLADGERQIAGVAETQNQQLRRQLEEMQSSQARLMDKLIACCKEPTGERTQRLFAFLREELEKRGAKASLPPEGAATSASAAG